MDALGLDTGRTALVMLAGTGQAGGEQFFGAFGDEGFIFAMGGDDHAQFLRQLKGLVEFGVVDAKGALVGEEDFERADAACDDFAELGGGLLIEFRHTHVKREVAGGFADGLFQPQLETGERVVRTRGAAHLDERGGAAEERGAAGGVVIILGIGAHEGQVDVDVRIDETGEDEFAGGVDDFGAGGRREIRADGGDGFAFAVDVRDVAGVGGDDFAVFN